MLRFGCSVIALSMLAGAAHAQWTSLYSQNFENWTGYAPEWSTNTVVDFNRTISAFAGRNSNTNLTLTLPAVNLPPRGDGTDGDNGGGGGGGGGGGNRFIQYRLTFDFYAIDSWDGTNAQFGQDFFNVNINNASLFNHAFSNWNQADQTFRAPDVGRTNLVFGTTLPDAIYRNIAIDFTAPNYTWLVIKFRDLGLQGMNDEAWGIDNVRVQYAVVPAPASLALVCVGGLATLRRRR